MIKLIINADDFGKNEGRTRAILEAFERGLITNTTLMVTNAYAEKAVKLARKAGVADRIGLHLNMTEGLPLTDDIKRVPNFCDKDGRFNQKFHLSSSSRLFLPKEAQSAVEKEVVAQLRRYLELGLTEMHLDSHHHSHTDISIARILFPIAKHMGFKSCRRSMDIKPSGRAVCKMAYKRLYNAYLSRYFASSDKFLSVTDFLSNIEAYHGQCVELMVHPIRCANGYGSPEDLRDKCIGEYETTCARLEYIVKLVRNKVQLVGYNVAEGNA